MYAYEPRPARFLEIYHCGAWKVKVYGLSVKGEAISPSFVRAACSHLKGWLAQSENYALPTYDLATLILHEGREGNFAIINWWIGENMLQNHVYYSTYEDPDNFSMFSDRGIQLCVWELEVVWFEREAWIRHVLMKHEQPDYEAYLRDIKI